MAKSINVTSGTTSLSLPLLDIKPITDLHAIPLPEVYKKLSARPEGLTEAEIKERQTQNDSFSGGF